MVCLVSAGRASQLKAFTKMFLLTNTFARRPLLESDFACLVVGYQRFF